MLTTRTHPLNKFLCCVFLLFISLFKFSAQAAEFCQEWDNWDSAPVSVEPTRLIDKAKDRQDEVSGHQLNADQIDALSAENAFFSAEQYCSRNQKTCREGRCRYVSSCEMGYSLSKNKLNANLSEINQDIDGSLGLPLMIRLQSAGVMRRARRICCTDKKEVSLNVTSCFQTRDQQFLSDSKRARVGVVTEDFLNSSVDQLKADLITKPSLNALVHPSCKMPVEPRVELIKLRNKGFFSNVVTAFNLTRHDFIRASGTAAGAATAAMTGVQVMGGVVDPIKSAQDRVLMTLQSSLGKWIGRFAQYLMLFSTGNDQEYYYKIFGLDTEEQDPDLEVVYAVFKEKIKKFGDQLRPSQIEYFEQLFQRLDRIIADFKYREVKGALVGDGENVIALLSRHVYGPVIRKSSLSLEVYKELKTEHDRLFRAFRMLGRRVPYTDTERFNKCKNGLKIHTEYKEFLMQVASNLIERTKLPRNKIETTDAYYMFSEPGTLKTWGVQQMAKCLKIPVCTINHRVLTAAEYEKKKDSRIGFDERLRREVLKCFEKTGSSSDGDNDITFNFDFILQVDDIDQILNKYLDPAKFAKVRDTIENRAADTKIIEVTEERDRFVSELKDLTDPSQDIPDSISAFPIDPSGMTVLESGNTLLPEYYQKKADDTAPPVGSRIKLVPVPAPDEPYRRERGEELVRLLEKRGLGIPNPSCQQKVEEVVNFDLERWLAKEKKLGIRPLFSVMKSLKGHFGTNRTCDGFSVENTAAPITEYFSPPDSSLLAYDFSSRVREKLDSFARELTRFDLTEIAKSKFDELRRSALNEAIPYEVRKSKFESIFRSFDFLLPREPEGQEVLESMINDRPLSDLQIKTNFKNILLKLINKKDKIQVEKWKELTSEIYRKIQDSTRKKRLIVLEPGPGADYWLIEKLAEVFDVPFIHFSGPSAYRVIHPEWYKYRTKPEFTLPTSSVYVNSFGYCKMLYDTENQVYFAESPDKKNVAIFSQQNMEYGSYSRPAASVSSIEFRQGSKVEFTWLKTAKELWAKRNRRFMGFVLIETAEPQLVIPKLKEAMNESAYQFPDSQNGDYTIMDLRKINFVVLPVRAEKYSESHEDSKDNKLGFKPNDTAKGDDKKDESSQGSEKTDKKDKKADSYFSFDFYEKKAKQLAKEKAAEERERFELSLPKDSDIFLVKLPGVLNENDIVTWARRRFVKFVSEEYTKKKLEVRYGAHDLNELESRIRKAFAENVNQSHPSEDISYTGDLMSSALLTSAAQSSDRSFEHLMESKLEIAERVIFEFADALQRRTQNIFDSMSVEDQEEDASMNELLDAAAND